MTNTQLLAALRKAIALGRRHSDLASAVGVSERTVFWWLERGKTPKNRLVRRQLEREVTK